MFGGRETSSIGMKTAKCIVDVSVRTFLGGRTGEREKLTSDPYNTNKNNETAFILRKNIYKKAETKKQRIFFFFHFGPKRVLTSPA